MLKVTPVLDTDLSRSVMTITNVDFALTLCQILAKNLTEVSSLIPTTTRGVILNIFLFCEEGRVWLESGNQREPSDVGASGTN